MPPHHPLREPGTRDSPFQSRESELSRFLARPPVFYLGMSVLIALAMGLSFGLGYLQAAEKYQKRIDRMNDRLYELLQMNAPQRSKRP